MGPSRASIILLATTAALASGAAVFARAPLEDTERPGAPRDVVATNRLDGTTHLDWTRSTDDTGISEYVILRNGVEYLRTGSDATEFVLDDLPRGVSFIQLFAVDTVGNRSVKTPPLVAVRDTDPPPAPAVLGWRLQADDPFSGDRPTVALQVRRPGDASGIASFRVLDRGVEVRTVSALGGSGSNLMIPLEIGPGTSYLQVQAIDGSGNESVRTAPIRVDVPTFEPPAPLVVTEIDHPSPDEMRITFDPPADPATVASVIVFGGTPETGGRVVFEQHLTEPTDQLRVPLAGKVDFPVFLAPIGTNALGTFGPAQPASSPLATSPYPATFLRSQPTVELDLDGRARLDIRPGDDIDGTSLSTEVEIDGEVVGLLDGPVVELPAEVGAYEVRLTSVAEDGRRGRTMAARVEVIDPIGLAPTPDPDTVYAAVDGDDVHLRFTPPPGSAFEESIVRYRVSGDLPGVGPDGTIVEVTLPPFDAAAGSPSFEAFSGDVRFADVAPGVYTIDITRLDGVVPALPSRPVTITVR